MAIQHSVPKQKLVERIRQIKNNRESGVLSIVTDSGRSVVLRFLEGRVTHSNARGKSIQEALQVLAQSASLRFSFSPLKVEEGSELMPTDEFVDQIEAGAVAEATPGGETARLPFDVERVRKILCDLAVAHIGPMTSLVVDEALQNANTLERVINTVARQIPNGIDAEAFRDQAWEKIRNS
ncbi:MAG: hypothetical protein Kow006_27830 [Gammaproteobacteria bacterium]